jgi:hypothetical protein
MAILVRSANLGTDAQLIIDFLAQNHTADSDQRRFNWLYRSGPAGEAQAWIAIDAKSGANIGIAAAFPRRMYVEGTEELGWVLGDFCIAQGHRSLGPAIELQRACLAGLDAARAAVYYDFPSETMTGVYRRLGISHTSRMVRLAQPLRVDSKLRGVIRRPNLARIVASAANLGLTLRSGTFRLPQGLTISLQESACGSEFTQLAQRLGPALGTCVQRSADYLNWRYRQHPFRRHEILTLRRDDSLTGYAVLSPEGQQLNLVDLFGDRDSIPVLLRGVVSIARRRKLETVTFGILAGHPWVAMIRSLGFYQREKCPVVIGQQGLASTKRIDCWFLTNGDRES